MRQLLAATIMIVLFCGSVPASAQGVTPVVAQGADARRAAEDAAILHLLNRTSFGPVPGAIATVRQLGMAVYLEQQLHPQQIAENPALTQRLAALPSLSASIAQLANEAADGVARGNASPAEKKEVRQRSQAAVRELTEAKILRAVMSNAQLQEVMVDFWFNHFNVFAEKGPVRVMIGAYERDAIRPYALGKFRNLLEATARSPAMLVYLDNFLNVDPDSPFTRGKKIGINENYAREIMELHTLGVDGGYTQRDVTVLAHIFTGWGLGRGPTLAEKAQFMFAPRLHDAKSQMFLNAVVPGGGVGEIEQALDTLARHPATARHIAFQLAQYFVADAPPDSLVQNLARVFMNTGGDITAVLRTLFQSPEFWDVKYRDAKFKPPFRFVVSALRVAGITPGDTNLLQGAIGQMGEPLYRCQTPNGYANTKESWLNSDALLKRIGFVKGLNRFLGSVPTLTIMDTLGDGGWGAAVLDEVGHAEPGMRNVLLLSSPGFLYF